MYKLEAGIGVDVDECGVEDVGRDRVQFESRGAGLEGVFGRHHVPVRDQVQIYLLREEGIMYNV